MAQHEDHEEWDETNPEDTAFNPPSESELWDSDEALESLKLERQYNPDETDQDLTKRLLTEAGPLAARSIINLAQHAANENTRLNASKYIADVVREVEAGTTGASWEQILGAAVTQVEEHANQGSGN
jgi:hypothetical protein